MSVIWELDTNYEVVNVWYGKTVIRSAYKLFYEVRHLNTFKIYERHQNLQQVSTECEDIIDYAC